MIMDKNLHSILKIYASTTDMIGHQLFYEHIVYLAREKGISGVTVFRGIMGYGLSSHIHSSKFWELTDKLPVVIEMIDTREKIEEFLSAIEDDLSKMPKGCLVTVEQVSVRLHKSGNKERGEKS